MNIKMSIKPVLHFQKHRTKNSGFTLIELLVVISIITLLSSVIFASVNIARAKARDSKKITESRQVSNAIALYYLKNNKVPSNYDCTAACVPTLTRATIEFEDVANPTAPTTEAGKAYKQTMTDLVTDGDLTAVPHSPDLNSYAYFDYGKGNALGGLFGTSLEAAAVTTTGLSGSCRPWLQCSTYPGPLADVDGDGVVTLLDKAIAQANINTPGTFAQGDVNGNGQVNITDVSIIQFQMGATCTVQTFTANLCQQVLSQEYCKCNPY